MSDTKQVLADSDTTFALLIKRLTGHLRQEVMKAWALFCWVGAQVTRKEYNTNKSAIEEGTPLWYSMKLKLGNSIVFAKLLTIMLREAQIPCVTISGKAKGSNYSVGDQKLKGDTFWNAVYVECGWYLCHPHWAFQSIVGVQDEHWIKVEDDGRQMAQQVQTYHGKLVSYQDSFYFLTDPEHFKYFCRPHDDQTAWQLLPAPASLETFINFPLVTSAFLTSSARFKFRRGQINTIKADCGESEVVIIAENSKWEGQLAYTLYYRADSENQFPSETSAEQYVILCNKNQEHEIKFLIRFPAAGIYRLMVIDKMKAKWLCDFKLVCDEPRVHCNPLPLNPDIGWGPGEASKRNGISNVSHADGIIKAKKEEKLEISFDTKTDTKVYARLKHFKKADEELEKFIIKKQNQSAVTMKLNLLDNDEYALTIDAKLPTGMFENVLNYPDNDEYALTIDAKLPTGMFENALNYLITSQLKNYIQRLSYENPTEMRIAASLESAIKGRRRDTLEAAIERFEKLGVEDPDILSRANDRLDVLRMKDDLHRAMLAERIDKLDKAIKNASRSKHVNELREMIDKANKILHDVKRSYWDTPHMASARN